MCCVVLCCLLSTLHEMVVRLVATGPEGLQYLCDRFESVYQEEEQQGEGEDVLLILNDLLAEEARQLQHSAGEGSHAPVPVSVPVPEKESEKESVPESEKESVKESEKESVPELASSPASPHGVPPLFAACMTRTLQVYMSHPSVTATLAGGEGGAAEEEHSGEGMQAFYANLTLLREFPLSLVTDVHRELYIKKMITKRRGGRPETTISPSCGEAYLLSGGYKLSAK
jgi:hypothetical protein